MENQFISVIIPTYKDWHRLQVCLNALDEQSYTKENFEVIVINNDPTEKCPFSLPAKNIKIITETKTGSYAARNTGIKIAKGEVLAFTDSDCIPDQNWLLNAINIFNNKDVDLIGGKVELFKEKCASQLAYIYEKNYAFKQHINVPNGCGVTANLFVKKHVIEKNGSFNSDINSGGDWEFTQKCVKNGFILKYANQVKVFHPARKKIYNILQKHYRFVAWGILNKRRLKNQPGIKIFLIIIHYEFKILMNLKRYPKNIYESFVVLYINVIRNVFKTTVAFLILTKLIDPYKIRK